jgi:hypothetical protein
MITPQHLNIIGLIVNAIGAILLIIFTSPPLDVTENGEHYMKWTSDPLSDEQRAANKRKYFWNKFGFKGGVVFLTVGYLIQLWAAVLG